jgi:hypothetical protein
MADCIPGSSRGTYVSARCTALFSAIRNGQTRAERHPLGFVIGERKVERTGAQEKIERVRIQGFHQHLAAEFQARRGVLRREERPVERIVVRGGGGDAPWPR